MNNINGLSKKLYNVNVPVIATYSEMEMETFGVMETVVDGEGKLNYENTTNVMLPLTRIIDIYIEGYPIMLTDRNSLTEIYNTLEDYLAGRVAVNSIHMAGKKDSRMEYIEMFIQEMFDTNKYRIAKAASGIADSFTAVGIRTFDQFNTKINHSVLTNKQPNNDADLASFERKNSNGYRRKAIIK